jgi:hypothetical protein
MSSRGDRAGPAANRGLRQNGSFAYTLRRQNVKDFDA